MNTLATPTIESAHRYFGRHKLDKDGIPSVNWERENLVTVRVPYPMRLAWNHDLSTLYIRCHKALKSKFLGALEGVFEFYNRDVFAMQSENMDIFGGCYVFKTGKGGALSPHAYGAAITIDPAGNPPGRKFKESSMRAPIADIFRSAGAEWGGDRALLPECGEFSFIHS